MINGKINPERRDIRALFLAPLIPCALLVVIDGTSRAIDFGPAYALGALLLGINVAIVMELFAFFLGLPLIKILRKHLHWLPLCVVLGGLIASLPLGLLALSLPDSASSNGVPTVINGVRTHQGYVELAISLAICFGFGTLGGGAFWWLRRPTNAPHADDENG